MQITAAKSLKSRHTTDLLILPFWQENESAKPAAAMKEFSSLYSLPIKTKDFGGKEGCALLLYRKQHKEKRILLLGLGKKTEATHETMRRAYAAATKVCRQKKVKSVAVLTPEGDFAQPILEGILLANYTFNHLKSDSLKDDPPVSLQKICLVGLDEKQVPKTRRTAKLIDAVNFARDLTNGNADDVTPEMLAKTAEDLAKEYSSIKTTIFDKKRIEKEKMGLLLAVNRGSFREPRFIILEYRGDPDSSDVTALVGKGITYDTGGLNIKVAGAGMETMKDDMSGAAAVLGTFKAAAALRLKVNLIGAVPSTENSTGSYSYKPGDVYTSYSGKTVEIANTDAEGRLVLADAISYVQKHYKPTRLIDLATLTGGIVIALGEHTTGLFSNDDQLAERLTKAGDATFERVWRMPIFPEYREALNSSIADIRNSADRKASPITAAMFIRDFVDKKMAWAHLDIAGTAYLSSPRHYHSTLATGVGVRLLIEFLSDTISEK
jgi:leucyl aminopeptidase